VLSALSCARRGWLAVAESALRLTSGHDGIGIGGADDVTRAGAGGGTRGQSRTERHGRGEERKEQRTNRMKGKEKDKGQRQIFSRCQSAVSPTVSDRGTQQSNGGQAPGTRADTSRPSAVCCLQCLRCVSRVLFAVLVWFFPPPSLLSCGPLLVQQAARRAGKRAEQSRGREQSKPEGGNRGNKATHAHALSGRKWRSCADHWCVVDATAGAH